MTDIVKSFYFLFMISCCVCKNFGKEEKTKVIDMRTSCISNTKSEIFLPFNTAESDSVVILVSFKLINPHCSVKIYTFSSQSIGIIVVMEFLGSPDKILCKNNIYITQDDNILNICDHPVPKVYKEVFLSNSITVNFQGKKADLENLIVTITSARISNNASCNSISEIACILRNSTFCINHLLLCDGDINCGEAEKYDEDREICNVLQEKTWWILLISIVIVCVVIYFLYRTIRRYVSIDYIDFFSLNDNTMENKAAIVTQEKVNKEEHWSVNQSNSKSHLELDTVSQDSSIITTNLKPSLSLRSYKHSDAKLNIIGENSHKITQKKVVCHNQNEGMKLKTVTYQDSRQPLKFTFYSSTAKL